MGQVNWKENGMRKCHHLRVNMAEHAASLPGGSMLRGFTVDLYDRHSPG
jgi:hypothetical protein